MLNNIITVLKAEIRQNNWIDEDLKETVIERLGDLGKRIGYDPNHLNQTKIDNLLKSVTINETFFMRNYITFKQFFYKEKLQLLSGNYDLMDTNFIPHEVNAYYAPETHELYLPAGILQFPIFDSQIPISLQYGSLGMIMGHELVHGIEAIMKEILDSSGNRTDKKYSKYKLIKRQFLRKMNCIIRQYGQYEIQGESLPSTLTWQEDLADNVGLKIAYTAYQKSGEPIYLLPETKLEADQLFFLNYAQIWCTSGISDNILRSLMRDDHSFWKYRINGPLSNMPEFARAFNCSKETPMNPVKKCRFRVQDEI